MTHRNESVTMKLARFRRTIMQEAEKECAEIERELEEYKERELSGWAASLLNKNAAAAERETARLQLRFARELSARRKEYRSRLLQLREKYLNQLRENAECRLLEYTKTPEYKDFLINKARALSEIKPESPARMLIRPDDEKYSAEIKEARGWSTVEISGEIIIGGILMICDSARIIADETLDCALNRQIALFRSSGKLEMWL